MILNYGLSGRLTPATGCKSPTDTLPRVKASRGMSRFGVAGVAGHGVAGPGESGQGMVWRGRRGLAWRGGAGLGEAWQAWQGMGSINVNLQSVKGKG